jgi:rod shape-determining protein MreD
VTALRTTAVGLALLTAVLLATVVAPTFAVFGQRPDLLALLVIAVAYHDGPVSGARVGFSAGLVGDLLSGSSGPVGVGALILLLVGHGAGVIRPYLAGTALLGEVALAAGGTLAAVLGYGFIGLLLDTAPSDPVLALQTALIVASYNAILAPFAFRLVGRLDARFPRSVMAPVSPWSPGQVSGQVPRG